MTLGTTLILGKRLVQMNQELIYTVDLTLTQRLGVWVLNCVGYDMDFQKRIVPESAAWQVDYERKKAAEAAKARIKFCQECFLSSNAPDTHRALSHRARRK